MTDEEVDGAKSPILVINPLVARWGPGNKFIVDMVTITKDKSTVAVYYAASLMSSRAPLARIIELVQTSFPCRQENMGITLCLTYRSVVPQGDPDGLG